jgi:hypothetical protein
VGAVATTKGVDLKEQYVLLLGDEPIEQRMMHCTGGFGCSPSAIGKAVFGKFVLFPERGSQRFDRYDFERVATDDEVAAVKEYYQQHGLLPVGAANDRDESYLRIMQPDKAHVVARNGEAYELLLYERSREGWTFSVLFEHADVLAVLKDLDKRLNK